MEFEKSKSKKPLIFVELMCDFPRTDTETMAEHPIADESLFLISTIDPWYGDIIIYLQTQTFQPELSRYIDERSITNPCNAILLETRFIIVVRILYFDAV